MTQQDDPGSCRTFLRYAGTAGATQCCAVAVERLLLTGVTVKTALILTCRGEPTSEHALLLTDSFGDETVVKAGFSSGYGGVGPKGLSETLALLEWHDVELEEALVSEELLERIEASALTIADLDAIRSARRVRPRRLWSYILEGDSQPRDRDNPWLRRAPVIPLGMLDPRIAHEARDFWSDPDGKLLKAHRLLEDAVRRKAGITPDEASGGPAKMYAQAFNGSAPRLAWPGITSSEHAGRTNLFLGALSAYRHPRAHRADASRPDEQLDELMLVNHLLRLEAASEPSGGRCGTGAARTTGVAREGVAALGRETAP